MVIYPLEMLTNGDAPTNTAYFRPALGGDMAVMRGIAKCLLEWEREAQANNRPAIFDHDFIARHTNGLDDYLALVDATSWQDIVEQSGLSKDDIYLAASMYCRADRVIMCWAMGITQHKHSVAIIQEIINVLRKYIPEEDRPWDTVDYEEVKEGAPYPEKPPPQKEPPAEDRCDASKVFQETLDHVSGQRPKLPWSSGVFKGLSEEGCISHDEAERLFPGPPAASFAEAHHDPPKPPVVPPSKCPLSLMEPLPSSKVVVEDVPAVDEDAIKREAEAWKAKGPNRTSSPLRPPTPPTPPPEDAPTPTPSPQAAAAPAPAPTPAFDYSRFDKLNVSDSDDEAQEHAHEFVDEGEVAAHVVGVEVPRAVVHRAGGGALGDGGVAAPLWLQLEVGGVEAEVLRRRVRVAREPPLDDGDALRLVHPCEERLALRVL